MGYRKYVPRRGTSGRCPLFFGRSDDFNIGILVFSSACHWPTEYCTQYVSVQLTSGGTLKGEGRGVAGLHRPKRNLENTDFVGTKNQTFHLIQCKSATEII